ncbi:type II toxin-antitoxin system Phd/YefM family antitoxin [candidate division WWE3 bacterium]|nr:type II toxin-antitoxin system Phd/YefM family antitoxin [candidate division WWE3 bacterium]
MSTLSISKLKENPSKAINQAFDYPIAIENRNRVQAYLIGKDLYENLVRYIEDSIDVAAVKTTDFSKGRNFEKVTDELGI